MQRRLKAVVALLIVPGLALGAGFWDEGFWDDGFWDDGFWDEDAQVLVTVPDVIGHDIETADSTLESVGLDTGTVLTRCSDEDEDIVLSQSPSAGSSVAPGSLVDLVASNGEECGPRGGTGISIGIGVHL